ncbi:hypothetical protein Tco_0700525 [Tanacetum coccineum]
MVKTGLVEAFDFSKFLLDITLCYFSKLLVEGIEILVFVKCLLHTLREDNGNILRTDNQEKDEKQSQNDKTVTRNGKDCERQKPESKRKSPKSPTEKSTGQSPQVKPRGQSSRNISLGAEIAKP